MFDKPSLMVVKIFTFNVEISTRNPRHESLQK